MTTWYILPPLDQLCDKCPIPRGCNESDPRCLRRLALAAGDVSQEKPNLREIKMLNYLAQHPNTYFRSVDLANVIEATYQTTLNLLWRLKDRDKVSHTGKGHTSRWIAKPSPEATAESGASAGTSATS